MYPYLTITIDAEPALRAKIVLRRAEREAEDDGHDSYVVNKLYVRAVPSTIGLHRPALGIRYNKCVCFNTTRRLMAITILIFFTQMFAFFAIRSSISSVSWASSFTLTVLIKCCRVETCPHVD